MAASYPQFFTFLQNIRSWKHSRIHPFLIIWYLAQGFQFFAAIRAESKLLEKLSGLYTEISEKTEALAEAEKAAESMEDNIEKVAYFHYTILAKMDDLRSSVDTAEALIPDSFLPYPTYDELLFSV